MTEKKIPKDVDTTKVQGWIEIIVRDKNGNIKYKAGAPPKAIMKGNPVPILTSFPAKELDFYFRKNIITNVGLACMVRLIFAGLTEDKFGYLAIGSGTTSESATDTALEYEVARKSASVSQTTTSITDDTALLEATFSSADGLSGSMNISETGIFNASSGGDLLARKVFSAVPVDWDAGDTLTIRYYVQMSR
mgnify:FL=1